MADPRLPFIIGAVFDNSVAGPVRFYNRTTGDFINVEVDSVKHAVADLANMTSALTDGDVIEIAITGSYEGFNTVTVVLPQEGGEIVTVSDVAISGTTEGVSI